MVSLSTQPAGFPVVSPWCPRTRPASAPPMSVPCDCVELLGPVAAQVEDAARMSPRSRIILVGAFLATGAAAAGCIPWGPGRSVSQAAASVSQVASQTKGAREIDVTILRELDKGGQLTLDGKPSDAFGALRALESGKPLGVGIPRMGYHPSANLSDRDGSMSAESVKAEHDQVVAPEIVTVTNFRQLERVNAAEKLTSADTSETLTQQERDMLALIAPFEGGVTDSRVKVDRLNEGTIYSYRSELPSPGILVANHRSTFRPADRLTALEAVDALQAGQSIVVRSPGGLEQAVRDGPGLVLLSRLEGPQSDAPVEVEDERDVQEALVRELAAGQLLGSPPTSIFVIEPTVLTGYQAAQRLLAGEPVVVKLGGGLSATVTSLKDLAQLNAEEGLAKVDTSKLLSERDQKTVVQLRVFEGRSSDSQQASLFATRETFWNKREVASSDRLNVREALQRLSSGQSIAVRTHRGQIHLIHNAEELDTLSLLVPPPAGDGAGSPTEPGQT